MPHLLICVDGDASDEDADACRDAARGLAGRAWTHRPWFVDQSDPVPVYSPDELPTLRTTGLAIDLPQPGESVDEQAVRS